MLARTALAFTSMLVFGCAGGSQSGSTTPGSAETSSTGSVDGDLTRGLLLMRQGRCADAIAEGFEPAAAAMEREFPAPRRADRVAELDMQALEAMVPGSAVSSRDLVPTVYPDTLYMIAFCLVELEDYVGAERYLLRALEVIPNDVAYLSEIGNIYHVRGDFQKALENYERAVTSIVALRRAAENRPLAMMGLDLPAWHRRALRGVGFSLIELDRLEEAEAIYREVLAIDPSDQQALAELQVIAERRRMR